MKLGWRNLGQMAALAALALALGLGSNFIARDRLPLLRPLPREVEATPVFGEADADFVMQVGRDPGTLLLDARIAAAYRQGHIPGALSLPLGEFAAAFPALEPRLRRARLLVVYCSAVTCSDSSDLAARLRVAGLKDLLVYRGGMADWTARGHDVAK
jgi:rhodanese-related sulfurtransferase